MKTNATLLILLLCVAISGCSKAPSESSINTAIAQTQSAQLALTQSAIPPSPTITTTFTPTFTPLPTDTPTARPTYTRRPTNTRVPTNTPTAEPLFFSGSGDMIVDFDWDTVGIVHFTNNGRGNFIVQSYDINGDRIDLLVNRIGNYDGVVMFNIRDDEIATRFSIESSGDWTIEIMPLGMARFVRIPATITGSGDDVVFIIGGTPDVLVIDASTADGNFIIFTWGDGRDLVVNEIAPYTGTVIINSETVLLEITAEGDWSIEVRTR